jgi:membrane glycosyltransferase
MAFPRLLHFGIRAGMRVWAVGQAFWQGDSGPYWGHNAIFRIAPFRAHCRLAPLPDGSPILSHDQVEAARLRAAGWGVAVWAEDEGSYEANPPAMPEFLHRDGRWLAGNLQYRHLLFLPGFTAMGRWQLVQAMLLFAGAPLYLAMFLLALPAAWQAPADYPRGPLLALAIAWPLALYAPKLLGYAETLAFPARRAAYGGAARLVLGAAAEIVFTLLLDAPSYVSKTLAMLRLALGRRPGWQPQNRADRGVSWAEAARLFWPHSLIGALAFATLWHAAPAMALLALPFAGGLLTSIPLCVLTAAPGFSGWLRAHGIAAMPEELGRDPLP